MDQTGDAEPQTPTSEHGSAPTTPTQKSSNASTRSKQADNVEAHDFANPTLNIIRHFSRSTSTSSIASKEETPPPLPPRPQLGVLNSRPSTSHSTAHSIAPSRPQLLSKATTQLSYANSQARGSDSRDESLTAKPRNFLDVHLPSRGASDTEDSASVRSYAPTIDAAGEAESILGEVMESQEKSEQERALLRSLGHKLVDAEAQSIFPPDPWFEKAFDREFDNIDEMKTDGSNEGQAYVMCLQVASADVENRSCYAPVARETEAFPHPLECRQAHIQPAWRRSTHHQLHWRCTDSHILLPVHQRYPERFHCRRGALCRHVERPSESGGHNATSRERFPTSRTT